MKVLAIETSCDETAVCIAESDKTEKNPLILAKVKILGDSISQVNQHAEYGGVYLVREHKKNLCPVLFEALKMFEEKNNIRFSWSNSSYMCSLGLNQLCWFLYKFCQSFILKLLGYTPFCCYMKSVRFVFRWKTLFDFF